MPSRELKRQTLFNKLDLRFAERYRVHPVIAAQILTDIYFYVEMYMNDTIDKPFPWNRILDYLHLKYVREGFKISRFSVRRWYEKMKAFKER